jgi:hypothetical protein
VLKSSREDSDLSTACGDSGGRRGLAAVAGLVLLFIGLPRMTLGQTQFSAGIATGAISCAQSANATGHLVCAEYSTTGTISGVSWQAPGTVGGPNVLAGNGDSVELLDTVDPEQISGTAAGTLHGAPGCGPANNNTGTTVCLIVSNGGTGFIFQGAAFYPAPAVVPAVLVSLDTRPAAQTISNPSCASANSNGAVVCAVVVDNQLYGIGFQPLTGVNTHLIALLSGTTGFTGNPNCTSPEGTLTVTCAIRRGGGLLGFAVQFNPTGPTLTTTGSIQVGNSSFVGDPACAIRGGGPTALICALVSGNSLVGIAFDPQTQGSATGLQSLGLPLDGGSWTGQVGCAQVPDFRNLQNPNVANPNGNLVSCAAVSSTSNVFAATFDPVTGSFFGINGPFAANINSVPSCVAPAVDKDEIACGATRRDGSSAAWRAPVGLLPQSVSAAVTSSLLN